MRQSPEILAPAGSMEALTAAVHCGADAVYIGATLFSARQNAHNFDAAALREAADFCHTNGVKLYLTVNTLVFDTEWAALDELLLRLELMLALYRIWALPTTFISGFRKCRCMLPHR